jgi:hypothetical protein
MKTEHHQTLKGLFDQYGFENLLAFLVARASDLEIDSKEEGYFSKEGYYRILKEKIFEAEEWFRNNIGK